MSVPPLNSQTDRPQRTKDVHVNLLALEAGHTQVNARIDRFANHFIANMEMSDPKVAAKRAVNIQTLEALLLGTNLTRRDHDILCIVLAVRERPRSRCRRCPGGIHDATPTA